MVQPPYATHSEPGAYGPVAGSSPNWSSSAFLDRGRVHGTSTSALTEGFQGWYSKDAQPEPRMRRHVDGPTSACYAEPTVQGAHSTYYTRRALPEDSPEAFRRSLRHIPQPDYVDRPTGKKFIPEPKGAPPRITNKTTTQPAPSGHIPEPGMPRLSRPYGATILRESNQELSYERAMGRKVRVDLDTYRGAGRAGDLSLSFAPPRRPEDDPSIFKTLKDSPTFTRFVNSLPPKPAVGPHQRRAEELKRAHHAEVAAERQLVASLSAPGHGAAEDE